jgi:hypothetical protein
VRLAQLDLPLNGKGKDTTYVDGVFFDNGQRIAVLETYANRLSVIDITADFQLKLAAQTDVIPAQKWPATVDILVDVNDDKKVWVITGLNMRMFRVSFMDMFRKQRDGQDADSTSHMNQIIPFEFVEGRFSVGPEIRLAEKFSPFYASFGPDKQLYISGLNTDFFGSTDLGSIEWYKNIASMLFKSVSIGRVLKINPEDGQISTAASGFGIYYHLAVVPDLGPLFTLIKFTGAISFPYVKPMWGIGVTSRGTFSIRKLDSKSMLPPYSIGHISYQ